MNNNSADVSDLAYVGIFNGTYFSDILSCQWIILICVLF